MDNAQLKQQVLELMVKNRRQNGDYQYTVPSPQTYPYQWLWDSCFHAIILSHFNVEDAKSELLSLISKQFKNGLLPHMIYWEKQDVKVFGSIKADIRWGREDTSTITQPPMAAYSAWQIYQKDSDVGFLKKIYPALNKFYRYLIAERDPRNHHLIGIVNPDESGEDNSPRFDLPLGLSPKHTLDENLKRRLRLVQDNKDCNFNIEGCMRNFFWVKDVPFNVIMIENLRILANIANLLGEEEDKKFFSEQVLLVQEAMKTLMFEDGLYWSTYDRDYKKIKVKTWAIFAPLFAKIYSPEEAKELVEKYLVKEDGFANNYLLSSVPKDEQSYDPNGFWRGPVWMAVNWFLYQGLKNYGFDSLAKKILDSSLELINKSGFREHYHPETGEGQGAEDFTWGGLVVDMLE